MSIPTVIALAALAAAIGSLVWCRALSRRVARALDHASELQELAHAGDIEGLTRIVERRLEALESADTCRQEDDAALASRLSKAVRHVGLVRYDAFENAAGEQSFSLAMLDDGGDGFVLTSIYGRGEYRMYAKSLRDRASSRSLTDEEREAIGQATGQGERGGQG